MIKKVWQIMSVVFLVAFLVLGVQAIAMPSHAKAIPCGRGDIECTAAESDGFDSFCPEIWWFVSFCFDVTYYHPPEPPPSCGESYCSQ